VFKKIIMNPNEFDYLDAEDELDVIVFPKRH
jgi:hypothetical protein